VVRLAEKYSLAQRDGLLKEMLKRGIQVSNYFPPAYLQPFMVEEFGYTEGDFPVTDSVCKSTVTLPFHNNLSAEDVELVCTELKGCLEAL
jgi:perosamine synthetase